MSKADARTAKRKRKNGTRRLCKGMCYSDPQITEQDRIWEDGDSPQSSSLAAPAALSLSKPPAAALGNEAVRLQQPPAKKRRTASAQDPSKGPQRKLSTSVSLLAADHQQDSSHSAARADLSEALQQLPEPLRRYLQSQGFSEAMPVQQR